jgi:hypothetical protein
MIRDYLGASERGLDDVGQNPKSTRRAILVRNASILLQKSKVAGSLFFGENTKREAITDSYNLNRIAEVAGEFNVRR